MAAETASARPISAAPPVAEAGRRAARPVFLTAAWRSLVMLNFEVDPQTLARYVPRGTELDLWQDRALISLVAFRFVDTRIRGWAIPGHVNFDEVNLRFYVRRRVGDDWRRGVVFLKEVAPRWAIAWVANTLYHEHYVTLPVRHAVTLPTSASAGRFHYAWRHRKQWLSVTAEVTGAPQPLAPGSEAEFITEHYWGYTRCPNGATLEYEVAHPRWNVWTTPAVDFQGDPTPLYGPEFGPLLQRPPRSALVAEGSAIAVHAGTRLTE